MVVVRGPARAQPSAGRQDPLQLPRRDHGHAERGVRRGLLERQESAAAAAASCHSSSVRHCGGWFNWHTGKAGDAGGHRPTAVMELVAMIPAVNGGGVPPPAWSLVLCLAGGPCVLVLGHFFSLCLCAYKRRSGPSSRSCTQAYKLHDHTTHNIHAAFAPVLRQHTYAHILHTVPSSHRRPCCGYRATQALLAFAEQWPYWSSSPWCRWRSWSRRLSSWCSSTGGCESRVCGGVLHCMPGGGGVGMREPSGLGYGAARASGARG